MQTLPTQVNAPWRTTLRTVFQAVIGFASAWAVIVQVLGLNPSWQWVSASLVVTAGITRVMALPAVELWLQTWLPWLSAQPAAKALPVAPDGPKAAG